MSSLQWEIILGALKEGATDGSTGHLSLNNAELPEWFPGNLKHRKGRGQVCRQPQGVKFSGTLITVAHCSFHSSAPQYCMYVSAVLLLPPWKSASVARSI